MTTREQGRQAREKGGTNRALHNIRTGRDLFDGAVVGRTVAPESLDGTRMVQRGIGGIRMALGFLDPGHVPDESLGGNKFVQRGIGGIRVALETLDGSHVAQRGIGGGRMALNFLGPEHVPDESLGGGKFGQRSIGGIRLALGGVGAPEVADLSLGGGKIVDRGLGGGKIALGGIGADEISNALNNPGRTIFGLRTIGSPNGTAVSVAGSDHFHSISYKHLAEGSRKRLLSARGAVSASKRENRAPPLEEMRDLVLGLAHMAMDDEDETAEERRGRELKGEIAEEMHDYGNGPEPRRKKRWNREVHPDLQSAGARP